ncbi:hypothetical protein VCRA2121O391_1610002 [Vibrio crassostreae]|nr:hypothetical protein VCRA2117O378_1470002 [Vibrio crassostreae]CAK1962378.1 hypothetical protein VCRA2113O199_270001 [Vibrio crassostreae]CAK2125457.1 hypothetical protein VCRA2115O371_500001 [Vibrio crassostreae]CAK2255305.1 hypothetical protein VCRA2113O356_810002 [Vibrio crassostreae]CAK2256328.1 hypothetical protein VCRA2113O324_930002 [Vibrio crassostreae]
MFSTEPKEFEYCENLYKQGQSLERAIEQTSRHFYGKDIDAFNQAIGAST